jgi:hypothetical protein
MKITEFNAFPLRETLPPYPGGRGETLERHSGQRLKHHRN